MGMNPALGQDGQNNSFMMERPLSDIDLHIGRVLRDRRLALNLSPEPVAAGLRVAVDTLHEIETGSKRLSAEQLFRFSKLFGLMPADLFQNVRLPHANELATKSRYAGELNIAELRC